MKAAWRWTRMCATVAVLIALVLPANPAVATAPLPRPIEQGSGQEQGVVRPGGAALYDVPGGTVIGTLEAVSFVSVYGRTEDAAWLVVAAGNGQTGWVEASRLIAYNVENLPVMMGETPAAGQPRPEQAATEPPATEPAPAAPLPTNTPQPPTPTRTPTRTPTPVPPTPTPTNTPTPVPPTATPTNTPLPPTPTRAALPTARPAPAVAELVAVVGVNGASLYDAPEGNVARTLPVGSTITLVGRDEAAAWLQARTAAGDTGWVLADAIVAFNIAGLPVTAGADAGAASPDAAGLAEAAVAETTPAEAASGAPEQAPPTAAPTPAPRATVARPAGSGALGGVAAAPTEITAPSVAGAPTSTPDPFLRPRPTPVNDGRPIATVLLTGGRLNVRSGPGTDYRIVAKGLPRERFALLGRTAAGDWLQVELLPDEGGRGWVSAQFVEANVPVADLPVVDGAEADSGPAAPVAPVVLPTPTPEADAPAPLPSPTPVPAPTAAAPSSYSTGPTGLRGNLVFQDGRDTIYAYALDTGVLRPLTTGFDPAISPDGRTVAFVRGGGADNGIYTIGIDGSNERKIWGEGEILRSPKWSPDGQRITYTRLVGSWRCFNIQFLGCKTLKQLIAEFPFLVIPAARRRFLRDAERLEFPNWGLSRVASDGSGDFRDIAALDSAVAPDWNTAGIVYQAVAGIEITEDKPDGATRAVLQEDWDHDPDWQPNGGFILFQSQEGSHWEIWRMTPEGTGVTALTRPVTTLVDKLPSNVAPAWSPDGQQIVYLSSRTDDEEHGPWRLWVMNADGSGKRLLPVDVPIDYTFASEQVVDWGP